MKAGTAATQRAHGIDQSEQSVAAAMAQFARPESATRQSRAGLRSALGAQERIDARLLRVWNPETQQPGRRTGLPQHRRECFGNLVASADFAGQQGAKSGLPFAYGVYGRLAIVEGDAIRRWNQGSQQEWARTTMVVRGGSGAPTSRRAMQHDADSRGVRLIKRKNTPRRVMPFHYPGNP